MKKLTFILREARFITRGLLSTKHPILAHLIPMRRCNLSCGYCNEYDKTSDPVPIEIVKHRVDLLAGLGTSIVTLSGGEPMLHPQVYEIFRQIRSHGMIAGLISNGYYMTRERIEKLNDAGLEYLQISIDNLTPDEISQKSLKVLDRYLRYLSQYAKFHVSINSVIGGGIKNPGDALTVARRAVELGFSSSLGIIHDGTGQLKSLSEKEAEIYEELKRFGKRSWTRFNRFQDDLAYGRSHDWRCRAGARYLYICEDGLVHYCSQQRGFPGVPLENYTREDIVREFYSEKPCAKFCTIACVQQVAMIDNWRAPQHPFSPPSEKERDHSFDGVLGES
ncbi:MAG: radical SAM protein [Acidobacteria bacterium]|nr:radical SAM protein [Acidobacteriota bacterium]MCI0660854.1 radical SAM protein [Acidobacteriota bacterium]